MPARALADERQALAMASRFPHQQRMLAMTQKR